MSLQTHDGPMPVERMSRQQRRCAVKVGKRALRGVGIEDRQQIELQRITAQILRPATDGEIELADMSRFPAEGTTR